MNQTQQKLKIYVGGDDGDSLEKQLISVKKKRQQAQSANAWLGYTLETGNRTSMAALVFGLTLVPEFLTTHPLLVLIQFLIVLLNQIYNLNILWRSREISLKEKITTTALIIVMVALLAIVAVTSMAIKQMVSYGTYLFLPILLLDMGYSIYKFIDTVTMPNVASQERLLSGLNVFTTTATVIAFIFFAFVPGVNLVAAGIILGVIPMVFGLIKVVAYLQRISALKALEHELITAQQQPEIDAERTRLIDAERDIEHEGLIATDRNVYDPILHADTNSTSESNKVSVETAQSAFANADNGQLGFLGEQHLLHRDHPHEVETPTEAAAVSQNRTASGDQEHVQPGKHH